MRTLKEDKNLVGAVAAARKIAESRGQTDMLIRYDTQLVNWQQRIELSTRAYTSTLFQVAEDYPPARRQAQHDILVADLGGERPDGARPVRYALYGRIDSLYMDPIARHAAADRAGDCGLSSPVMHCEEFT